LKILVTGGAGFIGSHVAEAFIAQGHEVTIVDDLSTGRRKNLPAGSEFVHADIRDPSLEELFARGRFDIVDHHAAQIDVRRSVAEPVLDVDVNVTGSVRLLELCRRHRVGRFIFASTGGAIYGEQERFPADERHKARPLSPYGVSKLSVEGYLFWANREFGIHAASLRYANVYGPRQSAEGEAGVVAIFCRKMVSGEQPVIHGDGAQTRDFIYIGDVVAANLAAADLDGFNIVNIGTGLETNINAVFSKLNGIFGGGFNAVHGPAQPGEQRRSSIDPSLARRILGWRPTVELDEGLKITADYFSNEHARL